MHVVNVDGLHLRSAPVVAAHTKLAAPQEGWLASRYLREQDESPPPVASTLSSPGIRPVHLDEDQPDVTRDTTGRAWRFPLGEAARPMRAPLLQEQADAGRVCIVVARRRDLTRPGHIAAVVPETAQHRARRTGTTVTAPLRCQAGARNFSYDRPVWWTRERFESFGYWSA